MSINDEHLADIKSILGSKGWKEDADELLPYLHEWRDRWQGQTPLLALPDSTKKTSELVSFCARHSIKITPQGGNTGLVGGQIPQGELLLSTKCLSRIHTLDVENATLTLEAGVTLAEARAAAREAGLLFPLSLASEGTATIGGVLSTNAGGMEVLRYGNTRDLTLGLEVVTATGDVWSALNGLRKDNTGYDLKHLFIGAEGTLGIITAAVLKLFPEPPIRKSAWCGLTSVKDAILLLALMRAKTGNALSKFELIPQIGVDYTVKNVPGNQAPLAKPSPWQIFVEFGFFDQTQADGLVEAVLSEAMEQGLVEDAVIAQSHTQAEAFLRLRESLSAAQKNEGAALKHDISVPVSSLARFIDEASGEAIRIVPNCRVFAFGHVGDGNVHFNILQPPGMDPDEFTRQGARLTQAVYDRVSALGGSVSAEHGIGILKKPELLTQKSDVEMQLMRAVKTALDPDNIMNPRVLF